MSYNPELCLEKHRRIDERLATHGRRLDDHDERIDQLEQHKSKVETTILFLCDKIDGLVKTMKWFIGLIVGALVTFFIYAAQKGLIR